MVEGVEVGEGARRVRERVDGRGGSERRLRRQFAEVEEAGGRRRAVRGEVEGRPVKVEGDTEERGRRHFI